MTTPKPAVGRASASGVRRSGDSYQDLLAWAAAMRVIQAGSDVHELEIEINGVGNVDDVVLRRTLRGDSLGQAKWSTTTASNVDEDFLTGQSRNGRSLLQKFFDSYQLVRNPDRQPTLELLTNRGLDAAHPLLGHVDGRTDLLIPYAADAPPTGKASQALRAWANHVGGSRESVLEMLELLTFRTGLTVSSERDRAQVLMSAAGLRHDDAALAQGLAAVADWVRGGRRTLTPEDISSVVEGLDLYQGSPRAILLIQAIDRDPHPEDALEVLNWVDRHDGNAPANRVQPLDPAAWDAMADEARAAADRLQAAGWTDILVRGAMRQATAFLVGTTLPDVRGHTLHYTQRGQEWSSDRTRSTDSQGRGSHWGRHRPGSRGRHLHGRLRRCDSVPHRGRGARRRPDPFDASGGGTRPSHNGPRPGHRLRAAASPGRARGSKRAPRQRDGPPVPCRTRRSCTAARPPLESRTTDPRVRAPGRWSRLHARIRDSCLALRRFFRRHKHGPKCAHPRAPRSEGRDCVYFPFR